MILMNSSLSFMPNTKLNNTFMILFVWGGSLGRQKQAVAGRLLSTDQSEAFFEVCIQYHSVPLVPLMPPVPVCTGLRSKWWHKYGQGAGLGRTVWSRGCFGWSRYVPR
jgi:hypothetical protein